MTSDCYVYVEVCSSNGTVNSEQVCLSYAHSISDTQSNKIILQLAFYYYVMYWPEDDRPLVKTCIHVIRIDNTCIDNTSIDNTSIDNTCIPKL